MLLGVFAVVHTTASAPATSPDDQKYDEFFKKYTARYFGNSADWRVFKAQAIVESGLRPTVVSPDIQEGLEAGMGRRDRRPREGRVRRREGRPPRKDQAEAGRGGD